jgi:beta-barrel assembly-enhancing protease
MKRIRLFVYMVIIAALTACSAGISLYTPQEQVQIGKQLDQEIRSNPKEYPITKDDSAVKDYIDKKIFRPILESPAVKYRTTFPYQLEIIHRDDVINAFATPGGYIYVYTGLLKYIDSESALAGILAHEIAHAENEHSSKRMFDAMALQGVASLFLKEGSSELLKTGVALGANGWLMKNSRTDEDESDKCSFNYLRTTRFYPGGVKFMFEKLKDDGAASSKSSNDKSILSTLVKGAESFFASHPEPIERIEVTNSRLTEAKIQLKTYKSNDKDMFKADYDKNIKKKLR